MLKVITTGGTIDKSYFDALSQYRFGPSAVPDVFVEANLKAECEIVSPFAKDSLEIAAADRQTILDLVSHARQRSILITHGTDTMTDTAIHLLGAAKKTVVLTGAFTPLNHKRSDAVFNIGFAAACACTLPIGVYIAIHGKIFDPQKVKKVRSLGSFVEIE